MEGFYRSRIDPHPDFECYSGSQVTGFGSMLAEDVGGFLLRTCVAFYKI